MKWIHFPWMSVQSWRLRYWLFLHTGPILKKNSSAEIPTADLPHLLHLGWRSRPLDHRDEIWNPKILCVFPKSWLSEIQTGLCSNFRHSLYIKCPKNGLLKTRFVRNPYKWSSFQHKARSFFLILNSLGYCLKTGCFKTGHFPCVQKPGVFYCGNVWNLRFSEICYQTQSHIT